MGISFLVRVGHGLRVKISWGAYRKTIIPWRNLWQAENSKIRKPENDPGFWFRTQFDKEEEYSGVDLLSRRLLPQARR